MPWPGAGRTRWTAPPASWSSPIQTELGIDDLRAVVSQLALPCPDDDQVEAFKTPVTLDVFSQPTEG